MLGAVKSDEIRTARKSVEVPFEKRQELARRLEGFEGGREAAEELRTRRAFSENRKRLVLDVLNGWLREVGKDEFGEELIELRYALDRDVRGI
jgi:hypothetical protein